MANDINRVFMIGRLTKDPELKYTQGGTAVASLSVANNKTFTQNNEKKEQVSFFSCVAWGKLGELIAQHCKKGERIGIEGRLQQRSWEKDGQKRSTVEIVVENFQFLSAKHGGEQTGGADGVMDHSADTSSQPSFDYLIEPDIPF